MDQIVVLQPPASASVMSHDASDSTQASHSNVGQAPWWRILFASHPGHAHKAPEAFFGNKGKAKVFCGRCLNAMVQEVEFEELSAVIVAFNTGADCVDLRSQDVIVNERACYAWILTCHVAFITSAL